MDHGPHHEAMLHTRSLNAPYHPSRSVQLFNRIIALENIANAAADFINPKVRKAAVFCSVKGEKQSLVV